MQWEYRLQLIEDHSRPLFELLSKLEEELNRKIVGYKFGEFFSPQVTDMVLHTYEVVEIAIDEAEELLRLAGLERLSKLVSKIFEVSYRSTSELLRLFQNFYMEHVRNKQASVQVAVEEEETAARSPEQQEEVIDREHVNLIKEIEQVLEGRYLVESRANSFAKEELAEISKNFQSLARYISEFATESKMSDVVADEEQLTKFVNSFHMIGTLTKSIEEDLEGSFKKIVFKTFRKKFCGLIEARENEYRASQRNYATQSDTIDGRIAKLETEIECLKQDAEKARLLNDHLFKELRQTQVELANSKDKLMKSECDLVAQKALLDISARDVRSATKQTIELQAKLIEANRQISLLESKLDQSHVQVQKFKKPAVSKMNSEAQTIGKSKSNNSSQTDFELAQPSSRDRMSKAFPFTKRSQVIRRKDSIVEDDKAKQANSNQNSQIVQSVQQAKPARPQVQRKVSCELPAPLQVQPAKPIVKSPSLCQSQVLVKQIIEPEHVHLQQGHKQTPIVLEEQAKQQANQQSLLDNVDQIQESEQSQQSRQSKKSRVSSQSRQNLQDEQSIPSRGSENSKQSRHFLSPKVLIVIDQGTQCDLQHKVGFNMPSGLLTRHGLLSRKELGDQEWKEGKEGKLKTLRRLDEEAGRSCKRIEEELKSHKRIEDQLIENINAAKLGFQEFKAIVRHLFHSNTSHYKINKMTQVKKFIEDLFENDSHYLQDQYSFKETNRESSLADKLGTELRREKAERAKLEEAVKQLKESNKTLHYQLQVKEKEKEKKRTILKLQKEPTTELKRAEVSSRVQSSRPKETSRTKGGSADWLFDKLDLQLFGGARQSFKFEAFATIREPGLSRRLTRNNLYAHKVNDSFAIQTTFPTKFNCRSPVTARVKAQAHRTTGKQLKAEGSRLARQGQQSQAGLSVLQMEHQFEQFELSSLHQLFEYLVHLKSRDQHKFKLINTFLKYPYDCVFNRRLEHSEVDLDQVKNIFLRILRKHSLCGPNCPHLARFAKRIGMTTWLARGRKVGQPHELAIK